MVDASSQVAFPALISYELSDAEANELLAPILDAVDGLPATDTDYPELTDPTQVARTVRADGSTYTCYGSCMDAADDLQTAIEEFTRLKFEVNDRTRSPALGGVDVVTRRGSFGANPSLPAWPIATPPETFECEELGGRACGAGVYLAEGEEAAELRALFEAWDDYSGVDIGRGIAFDRGGDFADEDRYWGVWIRDHDPLTPP